MIKKLYIILLLITSIAAIVGFFRTIDAALEIDDLKSGSYSKNMEMKFLQLLTNEALASCPITVEKFDKMAKENGYHFEWGNNKQIQMQSFTVTRHNSCIISISNSLISNSIHWGWSYESSSP